MPNIRADKPVRVGIYSSLKDADEVVAKLLAAGFTKDEITVVCSDQAIESHFREYEHQEPAGTFTPSTALAGGAIGAVLGGLAAVAGAAATGGVALLVAGGAAAWTGGIAGGLVGAMMSRGFEKEIANYYDQAVQRGMILIAVEDHSPKPAARLAKAEKIFAESNAEPLALPEG